MTDFFDKVKKLFSQAEDTQVPATHELIARSADETTAYRQWLKSKRFERLMASFRARVEGMDTADELYLQFIDSPSSRGFVLYYEEGVLTGMEMRHLLDYFKEQLLAVGYLSYMSDAKNQIKGDTVETIERHYLKPKLDFKDTSAKIPQRFGNITIEYLQRDNHPVDLRLLSNVYSDRKYTEARPFQELMELLVAK